MDDQSLLHLLKTAPEQGIEQFMKQYSGLIYSIVAGRTANTASTEDIEECVSDIIFEIYQKADNIDLGKGTLTAWASVVARKRAINLYRKKILEINRAASAESLDLQISSSVPEQEVLDEDERQQLLKAIKSLGEPDSTIIFRKYFFGQRSREIAVDLGMTSTAIDTRLSRAMNKLRNIWGGRV